MTCVGGLPFLGTEIKEETIQAGVQKHREGKEWERGRRENWLGCKMNEYI